MSYKTFLAIMAGMLIIFAVAIASGDELPKKRQISEVQQEIPEISQKDQILQYISSFNNGNGAAKYHMTAGCEDFDGFEPALYFVFDDRDLNCRDCWQFLQNELKPQMPMLAHYWRKITGTGIINLVNREGRHLWTWTDKSEFEAHDPFVPRDSA